MDDTTMKEASIIEEDLPKDVQQDNETTVAATMEVDNDIENKETGESNETIENSENDQSNEIIEMKETSENNKSIEDKEDIETEGENKDIIEDNNDNNLADPIETKHETNQDEQNHIKDHETEDNMEQPQLPQSVEISQQPYVNSPSSWQIPPNAFQQQQQQQQPSPSLPNQSIDKNDIKPYEPTNFLIEKASQKREKWEERIKQDEEDLDAWYSLMNDLQQAGDLDAIRNIYERFLKIYPTSAKHWLAYLELELQYSNFNEVEALFTRCLKSVLSVDLWKFYLGYIRRINSGEGGSMTPEARSIIEKAYEYVLSNVGIDKDAGSIWADYIYFLKSAETSNTWEEQRKMDSMRRVYQKSVAIPLNNVEHLWKEYDQWENNLNRLTAKKFLGEKSSAYMTARTALRESRPFTDNLIRNTIPKKPQWTEKEIEQLNLWKRYIQWEKGNPLHLEEKNAIIDRVSYVYQQAFLVLRFYPEIWYDYAMYYIELSKPEKALSILKQAMEILPTSLLVHFAYTEICESRKMLDEAKQGFDSILENLDNEIEKLKESVQVEVNKLTQRLEQERASMNLGDDIDGELREQLREKERRIKKEQDELEDQLKEQVDDIMQRCSLVWIAYMRFARRTDGIKAARALFSRARKTSNRTYHVFIASALMEYHNSKDATVAGKIFGLGNKSFADNEAYVCEYLDFLIQMNDDNNTRALFERSLASLPPEKSTAVWRKFMEYENKYGDLASVQNVESRLREVVPEVTQLDTFVSRYSYLDLQPIAETELGIEDTTPSDIQNISASEPETPQHEDEYDQQAFKEQSIIIGKNGEQKRLLLESVHPERYVRPDLNQWQAFKPSNEPLPPRNVSGNMTLGQAGNKDDHSKRTAKKTSPPPPFAPSSTSTAPGSSESVINKDGQPIATSSTQPQQQPSQQQVPPPQQQQQPLSQAPPPQQIHVPQPSSQQHPTPPLSQQPQRLQPQSPVTNLPDLITYFVTNLPSPSDYKGPILNAIELVDLLRNIALPSVPPNMPMRPQSLPLPSQQQQSSSSHLPPPSQQHPPPRTTILQGPKLSGGRDMPLRGRGRGGKRGGMGMGRGRGMKRKGMRDDNDDDYPINKGMGPNRPPDFDVFRARQAKRHRDDPPY